MLWRPCPPACRRRGRRGLVLLRSMRFRLVDRIMVHACMDGWMARWVYAHMYMCMYVCIYIYYVFQYICTQVYIYSLRPCDLSLADSRGARDTNRAGVPFPVFPSFTRLARGLIAVGCKTERRRSVAQPLKSDLSLVPSRKYDLPYTEPKILGKTNRKWHTRSPTHWNHQ